MDFRAGFVALTFLIFASPVSSEAGGVLSYRCGGGVTGGASGAVIHRDGRISRWTIERPGATRQERTLAKNQEGAARLFALLQDLNFGSIDFNHPHYNWHCSLSLSTKGKNHTVSWGHGRFPIPPEIQRIVSEVTELTAIPGG